MNRYARRTGTPDANEAVIVKELRDRGCVVVELDRPVDLLIGYNGIWTCAEVKVSPTANIRPTQSKFLKDCRAKGLPCILIDDLDDVDNWFPLPAAT